MESTTSTPNKRRNILISSAIGVCLLGGGAFLMNKSGGSSLPPEESAKVDSLVSLIDQPVATFDSASGQKVPVVEAPKMKEESLKKRDSIKVVQATSSPFKGKDCSEILSIYEAKVNEHLKSGNKKILEEIADWSNDIYFNGCKKMPDLKKKFNDIEKKLNGNDDEVY